MGEVSGASEWLQTVIEARVTPEPLEIGAECAALAAGAPLGAGGFAFFAGRVRAEDESGARILAMTLEHYPAMTERALRGIAEEAAQRWPLFGIRIHHRVGRLLPGEMIVFAGAASAHRAEAFAACRFAADYLKTRAPFWKKEETDGGARWVSQAAKDSAAATEWEEQAPQ